MVSAVYLTLYFMDTCYIILIFYVKNLLKFHILQILCTDKYINYKSVVHMIAGF